MNDTTSAMLFTVLSWWAATGVVLWLNHLSRRSYALTIAISSLLVLVCLTTIPAVADIHTPMATYLGFAQALGIWAWLEMTYLMGIVTGPNNRPCPPHVSELSRFKLAVATSLYHELAVIALGALIYSLSADGANRTVWWVYLVLWVMRWSAKLNLFLGVSNVNLDWFPEHLRYLGTYIRARRMNILFPVSMLAGFSMLMLLVTMIMQHQDPFQISAHTLAATLLGLGLLEHTFLVLPLNDSRLWRWFAPRRPSAPLPQLVYSASISAYNQDSEIEKSELTRPNKGHILSSASGNSIRTFIHRCSGDTVIQEFPVQHHTPDSRSRKSMV